MANDSVSRRDMLRLTGRIRRGQPRDGALAAAPRTASRPPLADGAELSERPHDGDGRGREVPTEDVDVAALARELVELYQPEAGTRNITLDYRGDGTAHIHGNRQLLAQAVVNLLENARLARAYEARHPFFGPCHWPSFRRSDAQHSLH